MTGIKKRLGSLLGPQGKPGTDAANVRFDEIEGKADNAVTRIGHIETVAGLAPGEVTDAQTANLLEQPESLTREAFGKAVAPVSTVSTAPRTDYPSQPNITWVETFQPGHGATVPLSTGAPLVEDTQDFVFGSQSVSVAAGPDTDFVSLQVTTDPLDITTRGLAVWLKIEAVNSSTGIAVQAGTSGLGSFYSWRIKAPGEASPRVREGEWALYYLTIGDRNTIVGSPDPKAIRTIRIRGMARGANDAFKINGVGHFPLKSPFPNGYCAITFDDGYESFIQAARRSLTPRGLKATSFTVPHLIGRNGFMTLEELVELRHEHGWDIQAHGQYAYPALTPEEMRKEWTATKQWFVANGFGSPDHLAYVGGQSDAQVVEVAREFFTSARTVYQGIETWPPSMPHRVMAYSSITSYPGGTSVATIKTRIDRAVEHGLPLVLTFHRIVDTPENTVDCSWEDLDEILDYLLASGIEVGTYADMFNYDNTEPPASQQTLGDVSGTLDLTSVVYSDHAEASITLAGDTTATLPNYGAKKRDLFLLVKQSTDVRHALVFDEAMAPGGEVIRPERGMSDLIHLENHGSFGWLATVKAKNLALQNDPGLESIAGPYREYAQPTKTTIQEMFFIGRVTGQFSYYAFDGRPATSAYFVRNSDASSNHSGTEAIIVNGSNYSSGAINEGDLVLIHYKASEASVHIGARSNGTGSWNGPFQAIVYDQALDTQQADDVIQYLLDAWS